MTDWQLGLQAFREGRMRESADRLQAALGENELTISQAARYETCAYLGAALYALGQQAEAVSVFEAAFQFSPTLVPSEDLIMNLTHAYLAAGRREAAREALRFLLYHLPGCVAASMLMLRLETSPADSSVGGAVLEASPEAAHTYIRTLTFTPSVHGGYDPAQVQEALRQLERLIHGLTQKVQQSQEQINQQELEITRYRQMEDAVVDNIVQMQRHDPQNLSGASKSELSPIEILFQQKS